MDRVMFTYQQQPMFGTVIKSTRKELTINPDYVDDAVKVPPSNVIPLVQPVEIEMAANLVPVTGMEQLLAAANLTLTRQLAAALEALAALKGAHCE